MSRTALLGVRIALLTIATEAAILGRSQSQTRCQPEPSKAQSCPELRVIEPPSLGDVARKLKAARAKSRLKPAKVFTNANLPTGPDGISIVGPSAPEGPQSQPGVEAATEPEAGHGEAYYARAMAKLQAELDLHQRELAVLQQKLNLAEPQYYPNPSQALQEQYSRADINRMTLEIEAKKRQISEDEQAIGELSEQLRREGGDPGWLRAGAAAASRGQAEGEEEQPPAVEAGAKGEARTREYWQARFKSARARVKDAEEEHQLAEDELALLKTRQITEAAGGSQLQREISVKQAEVETKKVAEAQAEDALTALEKEFKESDAPPDWIEPAESPAERP